MSCPQHEEPVSPPADTSPGRGSGWVPAEQRWGWLVRDERVGAAERGSENPLRMRPQRGGGEGYK